MPSSRSIPSSFSLRRVRPLWLAIAAILLLAIIVYFAGAEDAPPSSSSSAPSVAVMKVNRLPLSDTFEAIGTTQAEESVTLTTNVSEKLAEIRFTDGERVKKGQVLARFDQQEEQAQLAAAQSSLAESQRELARLSGLLKQKAAAQREVDERKTQRDIALHTIEEVKARIADRTIIAPFDGVLGIRRLSEGAMVQPGDVLTTLDALDRIKLDFTLPARTLPFIKSGVALEATTDVLPGEIFRGNVATIDSRIDPQTRSYLVRALLDNPDHRLKPGLLMQVTLQQPAREAVAVPEESLIQRQDKQFLMIVDDDGKARQREVKTGIRQKDKVEVTVGLKAGETLIIRGQENAKDGMPVTIRREQPNADAPLFDAETPPAEER
jgi:membrane fusion protein, multidrug efflux system